MRKETIITIPDGDLTLEFKIKAMPATKAYDFMARGLLLLGGGDGKAGEAALTGGDMPAILAALSRAGYEQIKPLSDELLSTCRRLTRGAGGQIEAEQQCTPNTMDAFITDPRTIFQLQKEALKLNFSFLSRGGEENSASPESVNLGRPGKAGA